MRRLVAHVPHATFADGSSCDVDLWLSPEAAEPSEVFGAMVVLRDREDRYAVVWSPRREEWSTPGGGREPGESVRECAVREVREETGLVIDPEVLEPVGAEQFGPAAGGARWPAGGFLQLFTAVLDRPSPPLVAREADAVDPQWVSAQDLQARCGDRFWWPLVAAVLAG